METDIIEGLNLCLETIFPMEAAYGSKSSLFGKGLENGIVTREEYQKAKDYYGKLWNYCGD